MARLFHMTLRLLFCVALLALPAAGCSSLQVRQATVTGAKGNKASRIPPDVVVQVLREEATFPAKRSLTIRLSRKVSEDELALIAEELKSKDAREFDKTFICYFLPDMRIGAGAWASSHFEPELQVKILGIPAGEITHAGAPPEGSTQLGAWSDEVTGGILTLLESESGLAMRIEFKGKSLKTTELVESKAGKRRRLDPKEKSRFGDHYVVAESGVLELWDSDGLIRTAASVKEK